MPSYLVGVVVFFKPLYHIFIVMFVHRKILKPREMVSRSALAYLHIRWNDLPFRRVEKMSDLATRQKFKSAKLWKYAHFSRTRFWWPFPIFCELHPIPHVDLSWDGQQLKMPTAANETSHAMVIGITFNIFAELFCFPVYLLDQLNLKSLESNKNKICWVHAVWCQSGRGQKSLDFSTIGKKKEEHFLLLRRRGKFRYRRLSGEEIFPDRQKYFQVFTTVSWYFTALAKVGDTTFTITAAKTVCNRVKNKSQIQRRDEILRKCKIIV